MTVILCTSRCLLRSSNRAATGLGLWKRTARPVIGARVLQRWLHDDGQVAPESVTNAARSSPGDSKYWKEYKDSYTAPISSSFFDIQNLSDQLSTRKTACGFLSSVRRLSDALLFVIVREGVGREVQVLVRDVELGKKIYSMPTNSAVSVTGTLQLKRKPKNSEGTPSAELVTAKDVEIVAEDFICLNSFDESIPSAPGHVYPPTSRHLQIRFHDKLQADLLFRSEVLQYSRKAFSDFTEVETPILFKSTPEGAQEFLVPTREKRLAYALPQSPQQYKQLLMASGIKKYVQFARCFRDEDLRKDRQPEFTQIDLEMAWTDGDGVMARVEQFIRDLYENVTHPQMPLPPLDQAPFYRMDYDEAMTEHGSDKPDLRIPGLIHRVGHILPKELIGMITTIKDPIVEAYKIRLDGTPDAVKTFVQEFFDHEGAEFMKTPGGGPGVAIYDPRKPVEGLQTFGFEGAEAIKDFYSSIPKGRLNSDDDHEIATSFDEGDLIVLQARPYSPNAGGHTALGNIRRAIYRAAVAQGLIKADPRHIYLWVTGFPMFTLNKYLEARQGGKSGFSATHHPFTAPKTVADIDYLLTDPLKAKADHYDLVVNGVELGGGSRRIHSAEMQRFIMHDVLKMKRHKIATFDHLLGALAAGCPPHAGLALGFDRLMAVLCGTDSVRDVIAFPKNGNGVDLMVGSPSRISLRQWKPYHLVPVYSTAAR